MWVLEKKEMWALEIQSAKSQEPKRVRTVGVTGKADHSGQG